LNEEKITDPGPNFETCPFNVTSSVPSRMMMISSWGWRLAGRELADVHGDPLPSDRHAVENLAGCRPIGAGAHRQIAKLIGFRLQ
jgi:anti-sigma factor ChrR (cupin superfamily)